MDARSVEVDDLFNPCSVTVGCVSPGEDLGKLRSVQASTSFLAHKPGGFGRSHAINLRFWGTNCYSFRRKRRI